LPDDGFSSKPKNIASKEQINLAVRDVLYYLSALHISQRDENDKDMSSGAAQLNNWDPSLE
jgi:hypothetical protein